MRRRVWSLFAWFDVLRRWARSAARPRRLWAGGAQADGDMAEQRCIGAGTGEGDTDTGRGFDDPGLRP
jgi:hypothetical protein